MNEWKSESIDREAMSDWWMSGSQRFVRLR